MRVANLLVEEPYALMRARTDLWEPWRVIARATRPELIKAGLNVRACRNLTWQNVYIIMPVTISLPLPALDSIVLTLVMISLSRSRTKYFGFQGGTPHQPSKGGSRYEIPRSQLGPT